MNKPLKTVHPHEIIPLPWNKLPVTQKNRLVAKLAELALRQSQMKALEEEPSDE